MPNLEAIYRQTVRPLPPSERRRLAEIILEHEREETAAKKPKRPISAYQLLKNMPPHRLFKDAAAVDEYIRAERDSWDD